jgi:hypothetical protein
MTEQEKIFQGVAGRDDVIEHSHMDTKLTTNTTPQSMIDNWGAPAPASPSVDKASSNAQTSKDDEKQ